MLRAIFIFIVVALLSALAIWLADNPGDLTMHWRGYEIRTSFVVGVGVMALAAFLVLLVYRIVSGFIDTLASVAAFLKAPPAKGFLALSRGMVAVAADAPEAKRYARRRTSFRCAAADAAARAQAAQLEGDEKSATGYFERMLEAPETAFLGLRGLFIQRAPRR